MATYPLARIGKLLFASAALTLGIWVLADAKFGPMVTEAVTNAPLVELIAPADGYVSPLADEGELLVPGQDVLVFSAIAPLAAEGLQLGGLQNQGRAGTGSEHAAETPLATDITGRLWQWRSPNGTLHRSGESVGDVVDCSRLIAVSQAATSRAAEVQVGDSATFSAGGVHWNGTVQRIVAGAPNLSARYAVQFPTAIPDNYLIFVALEVPVSSPNDCAVGLRGRVHFAQDAEGLWSRLRAAPLEVVSRMLTGAKTLSAHAGI